MVNGNHNNGHNEPIIRLQQVVKIYQTAAGPFTVLKGLDAEFYPGEFIAVIGKSGSGKSTLINMITGIDRPTSGEVWVAGTPVHKLNENQMAIWRGKNLGIVFQFFQLLPTLSLVENIMLPMDFCEVWSYGERRKRAMRLLELVEMDEHAHKLPSAISGGQQQRVAIARALANDPPLVLADEPTGNLDSSTASSVFRLFENLVAEGKTVIMVTHDTSQTQRVHRTLRLSDGESVNEYVARALPSLTHEQMLTATRKLTPLHFAPGAEIVQQGAPGDMFYIITRGVVEVALSRPDGADVIANTMSAGEYFGEIELVRGGRCIATVRAGPHTPVQVLALDRPTFVELLSASEQTRDAVGRVVEQRLAENLAASRRN